MTTEIETWELVPCYRAPVMGEIRYLRHMIPNPGEPLAGIPVPIFYQATWTGKEWLPIDAR